ncbi:MAG: hydroxyethylthiazole kinase [Paracoccaceae bacterium]|jgi:hydroxyethylthiazole kinase
MIDLAAHLTHMRGAAPLVHNFANYVSMNVMANVLLAAGASPAMIHAREEAAEFAAIAQALSVNIGTLSPAWVEAMQDAARVMTAAGKPWVLDPVAVGATAYRRAVGADLLALSPSIIRGNASEIMALAGASAAGKGADAADEVAAAESAARGLASATGAVVAVTGPVDFVTDGDAAWRVSNGDPMMPKVTALGCSLSALVAAFAVGQDPLAATVAALAFYGLAGERAAVGAQGPGSFAVRFVDQLHAITPADLAQGGRVARA